MFPSTPSSNSTSKSFAANARPEPTPTPPSFLTRSRIPLAQRIQKRINRLQGGTKNESPSKDARAHSTMNAKASSSRVSPSPSRFGGERMHRATSGHFKRPSLETNCLIAKGEDVATFFQQPPLSQQPGAVDASTTSLWGEASSSRSFDRSSHSGTPNLNLSSSRLNFSPSNIPTLESPLTRTAVTQIRARVRGHMRAASRSFAHETIQEEVQHHGDVGVESPMPSLTSLQLTTPELVQHNTRRREREKRKTLEKCYALKHEAEVTVTESRKQWVDTPYSISAVQNFQPPHDVESIRTLLQDSKRNFRPLPSELRQHRRRTSRNFRTSPYAQAQISRLVSPQKTTVSPSPSLARTKATADEITSPYVTASPTVPVLQNVTPINSKSSFIRPAPKRSTSKVPVPKDKEGRSRNEGRQFNKDGLEFLKQGTPKLKSASAPRRTPGGGLSKRKQKDKENMDQEIPRTPGSSLKIDRPRPRYRTPTPGPKRRPVK